MTRGEGIPATRSTSASASDRLLAIADEIIE
jgi:hypothetical protein